MIEQRPKEGRPAWQEPRTISAEVRDRILELHRHGMSRNGIAELFNRQGVPTVAGGKRWYASTIQRVTDPGK